MIFRNLLFFSAVILLLGWVLAVFVWKHAGGFVHIWLALAIISFVIGITRRAGPDVE